MKKHWIQFYAGMPYGPMTFWVHRAADGNNWFDSKEHDPPLPRPVPGHGYPGFHVECDGFTFRFSSFDEMDECIDILGQKLLPSTLEMKRRRGSVKGPNSHWLSRLPVKVKSWRYREKAVAYLVKARGEFVEELKKW